MASNISFHPPVTKITSEKKYVLEKGIQNHYCEKDLVPYLLGHVSEPSKYEHKIAWFNSNEFFSGLIFLTISKDFLYHIEHTECPFIAWTIIWQLYGDIDSSSESDGSLGNQASMGDTKILVAPSCIDTSFLDD